MIEKIHLKIGNKDLGTIDIKKGITKRQETELIWAAILSTVILYHEGDTAEITFKGYSRRFKVKQPFVFHGFHDSKVYVTIPISLEALRGLGFISKPSLNRGKTK